MEEEKDGRGERVGKENGSERRRNWKRGVVTKTGKRKRIENKGCKTKAERGE